MTQESTTLFAASGGDAAVAAEEARGRALAETELRTIDPDKITVVYDNDRGSGTTHARILDTEHLRTAPRRVMASRTFRSALDLATYARLHRTDTTTAWCDMQSGRITVVLDDHGPQNPSWVSHIATLIPRKTLAWERWLALDGQLVDQVTFAEHLEQSLPEIVEPDGATLLEVAQTFQQSTKLAFRAGTRLSDGRLQLRYEEEVETSAGVTGQLDVPTEFVLALEPVEGSEPFRVEARLRTRVREGKLSIGYVLVRPRDTWEAAIDDMRTAFAERAEIEVWAGAPS